MKRGLAQRFGLLLGVAALLALAVWQVRSDHAQQPAALTAIDPASIQRIDLQFGNGQPEHYLRRNAQWWRVDNGVLKPADPLRLGELARIAQAPVSSWRPLRDFHADKIGLAPPQAKLELDGQPLLFGAMTAIGKEVYVQVGAQVAQVSLRYMPRSAQGPAQTMQAN